MPAPVPSSFPIDVISYPPANHIVVEPPLPSAAVLVSALAPAPAPTPENGPCRSEKRIASRMLRKRRDPRMEGSAPAHLRAGALSLSAARSRRTKGQRERGRGEGGDARDDDVDVAVVVRPDDGVDGELDEDPEDDVVQTRSMATKRSAIRCSNSRYEVYQATAPTKPISHSRDIARRTCLEPTP